VAAISLLFGAFAVHGAKLQVTPVQKVIALLGDLSAKITAEGAKEAAQYDKFACFCKEQATEKQIAIEKSTVKLASNSARQGNLDDTITQLSNEIGNLQADISAGNDKIAELTEKRRKTHAAYLQESEDIAGATQDSAEAIAALEAQLGTQKSEWNDDTDLLQEDKKLGLLQAVAKHQAASEVADLLAMFKADGSSSAPKLGYDATYTILTSLKKFTQKFKAQAATVDADEGKSKDISDRSILGAKRNNQFSEKARREKEEQLTVATSELEDSKADSNKESKDMASDEKFLKELTGQCEEKAGLFDQRSKARVAEQTALMSATDVLKKGTPPKGAVGKMAEISKNTHTAKRLVAVSLLQINREAGQKAAIKRVRSFLEEAVASTGSDALSSVSIRMLVAGDHFSKVRGLIKDMVSKLEADAKSEASKKQFCDEGIKKGTTDRDDAQAATEDAQSKIAKGTAEKVELEEATADLRAQISDIMKGKNEATELRNDEKKNNIETIATSDQAVAAVESALATLKVFYEGALLQWTPENADRSGKTVNDRATEVFQSSYHGAQDAGKGIIAILDVCLADFKGVSAKTTKDENAAASAYDAFVIEQDASIASKQSVIDDNNGRVTELKATIVDEKSNLNDARTLFDQGTSSLEKLRKDCDLDGEPFANRKDARKEEIESLKEAMELLDSWSKE